MRAAPGAYFLSRLHDAFDLHPNVGEVRGVGVLAAIEFVADKHSKAGFPIDQKIGPKVARRWLGKVLLREQLCLFFAEESPFTDPPGVQITQNLPAPAKDEPRHYR